jgi:hypothetical protein
MVADVSLAPVVNIISPDWVQEVEVILAPVLAPPYLSTVIQLFIPLTAFTQAFTE